MLHFVILHLDFADLMLKVNHHCIHDFDFTVIACLWSRLSRTTSEYLCRTVTPSNSQRCGSPRNEVIQARNSSTRLGSSCRLRAAFSDHFSVTSSHRRLSLLWRPRKISIGPPHPAPARPRWQCYLAERPFLAERYQTGTSSWSSPPMATDVRISQLWASILGSSDHEFKDVKLDIGSYRISVSQTRSMKIRLPNQEGKFPFSAPDTVAIEAWLPAARNELLASDVLLFEAGTKEPRA